MKQKKFQKSRALKIMVTVKSIKTVSWRNIQKYNEEDQSEITQKMKFILCKTI